MYVKIFLSLKMRGDYTLAYYINGIIVWLKI